MYSADFNSAKSGLLIFGGCFNPIHHVHLQMAYDVASFFHLREIMLIPNFQTPGKDPIKGLDPQKRFEITLQEATAFQETHPPPPFFTVSQIELVQKKPVYTVDTLRTIAQIEPRRYLLVGLDQFNTFDKWKDHEDIFRLADVCVVNRGDHLLPKEVTIDHNESEKVATYKWNQQFEIHFFKQEYDTRSSSEIRKLIRNEQYDHPWLKDYLPSTLNQLKLAYR